MKSIKVKVVLLTLLVLIIPIELQAKEHPILILTKEGVEEIRK
jgi:hypothetical protein